MRIARPGDWKTIPLPEQRARIPMDRAFTAGETLQILAGVVPRQMEDKWFIVWEAEHLSFHRSWTGACIYRARFEPDGDGARLVEVLVNRNPNQYSNTDDASDAEILLFLIDTLLLRAHARFPSKERDPGQRALHTWGMIGRAMMGEHPGED